MVFVWEEVVKGQLVWGGEQGQFITTWLSLWSKILASFPLVYWANSEQLLIWYLVYQNQNRPFQQEAKSYMIRHRKCAYFSWLFQAEKQSETKHLKKKLPVRYKEVRSRYCASAAIISNLMLYEQSRCLLVIEKSWFIFLLGTICCTYVKPRAVKFYNRDN